MSANQYIGVIDAVDWRHGMLISPQHFQQQETYFDSLTAHQLFVSQPHYWGLIDIEMNSSQLDSGAVEVTRLHAVLPDGQVIDIDARDRDENAEGDQLPLLGNVPSDEKSKKEMAAEGLLVSVGVFRRNLPREGSANETNLRRYDSFNKKNIADENNPNKVVDITKKRVRAELLFGKNPDTRFVSLPLFRLKKTTVGYELTDYHPPMLNLAVAENLLNSKSLCRRLKTALVQMRDKAKQIAAANVLGAQVSVPMMTHMLAKLPTLETMLDMKVQIHPFQLYLAYIDLIASLKAETFTDDIFKPARYFHNDLFEGFRENLEYLAEQIAAVKLPITSTQFDQDETQPERFQIQLPDAMDLSKEIFVHLVPGEGLTQEDTSHWITMAKIAGGNEMAAVEKRRVYGRPRQGLEMEARKQLGLPVSGIVMRVEGAASNSKSEEARKLIIVGDERKVPSAIYFCELNDSNNSGTA